MTTDGSDGLEASGETLAGLRRWCAEERWSAQWIDVGQDRIDAFAQATGDTNWIHTDPKRALDETPFGGSIAHGFLLLSLTVGDDVTEITRLPGISQVLNYGLDKVRFLTPVRSGARVRVHSRVESLAEKQPRRWLVRQMKTLHVEGQAGPAMVAEQLALLVLR